MLKDKKIIFTLSFLALVIIVSVLFLLNKTNNNQRISAKLITSVHKDLPLEFKTDKNLIILKPGEVKTINYYVRNLSEKNITGMATFQVYPPELKDYMTKMNCFCYEEQTFKVGEKEKYALVLLVDPNVTKNIKEAIIQFIFFKK